MVSGNTHISSQLSPSSNIVLDTLENLLAPGGRAHLSPFIEATQIYTLFGQWVDFKHRGHSTADILNRHKEKVASLAGIWANFRNAGRNFSAELYSLDDFLPAYLAYYSSVNIAKLQITLLDLLRAGELAHPSWQVSDLGVGAGTSFLAVADFLLAWKTVCDLYQAPFPVEEVGFVGLDKNPVALQYAQKTAYTYANALCMDRGVTENDFIAKLKNALEMSQWHAFDLEEGAFLPDGITPTLLIASNVFSELRPKGKAQFTKLIETLPEESTALIMEPGDMKCAKT